MRAILLALAVLSSTAHADTITVGLFSPTEPFPSTAARVDLASRLAEHVSKALGQPANGKVFARASDFAAAIKKGEVTLAVVDAPYLAATGSFNVVAAAQRGDTTTHGWQLVARGADSIAALKGKRVLVPAIGGRETEFVTNVLFGGEINRDYFGKIETSPDTASALAALGLGKADAAVVPAGIEIPSGTNVVLALPALPGPMLVVYGSVDRAGVATAVSSFRGDATIAGFREGDADAVRSVARRFAPPVRRGPLAVPAVRLLVGDLVEGRSFAIERTSAAAFVVSPDRH